MSTAISKLYIKRNNDKSYPITVTKDDVAVDITGWTIYFSVKENRNDSDSDALIYKTISSHTDASNGESVISISASDTETVDPGEYYYDLLFIDDSNKRQSSDTGKFQIIQETTDGDS